jgi:hypothetical protein
MARKVIERFDVGGIKVEIGPAISKDAGLVVVARNIRESAWFPPLVDRVMAAIVASPNFEGSSAAALRAASLTEPPAEVPDLERSRGDGALWVFRPTGFQG